MERPSTSLQDIAIRAFAYTILLVVVGFLPAFDIALNPFDREILFTEFSFSQLAQSLTLATNIVLLAWLVRRRVVPQLSLFFLALFVCALVRESDTFLDALFNGLWQTIVGLTLVGLVLYFVSNRDAIREQFSWLTRHYSLGLIMAGFVVVMGFSRSFGRGEMWQAMMGTHYTKTIKYFAEESVELLGYAILTIGIVEFCIAALGHFDRFGTSTERHRAIGTPAV